MTVSTQIRKVVHDGNGTTTVWPLAAYTTDESHVEVFEYDEATDVTTGPLSSSLYSVAGIGVSTGISVTYPLSGPALGSTKKIILQRTVPYNQLTDIRNQGGFFPEVIEDAYDLLEMQIQQNSEKADMPPVPKPGYVAVINADGSGLDNASEDFQSKLNNLANFSGRYKMTGDEVRYVDSALGTGDGSAAGADAWGGIQEAYDEICKWDLNGYTVTILVRGQQEAVVLSGHPAGLTNADSILFSGVSDPDPPLILAQTSESVAVAMTGTKVYFNNFTIKALGDDASGDPATVGLQANGGDSWFKAGQITSKNLWVGTPSHRESAIFHAHDGGRFEVAGPWTPEGDMDCCLKATDTGYMTVSILGGHAIQYGQTEAATDPMINCNYYTKLEGTIRFKAFNSNQITHDFTNAPTTRANTWPAEAEEGGAISASGISMDPDAVGGDGNYLWGGSNGEPREMRSGYIFTNETTQQRIRTGRFNVNSAGKAGTTHVEQIRGLFWPRRLRVALIDEVNADRFSQGVMGQDIGWQNYFATNNGTTANTWKSAYSSGSGTPKIGFGGSGTNMATVEITKRYDDGFDVSIAFGGTATGVWYFGYKIE